MSKLLVYLTFAISMSKVTCDKRHAILSPGNLLLEWTPASESLILRVEAKTLGFFALSFGSVHGSSTQDAVLGWTSDAEVLLQDGVVGRDGRIAADRVNDYELLEGTRNDSNFLSVTLQRRWSTCDEIEDFPLGAGSVLVSWALYPRPPENLELFPRLEDGERHGSLVVVFNSPPKPHLPSDGLHVWPVLMPQIRLSTNSTAQKWCAMYQVPEMRTRHWIVGFRAEIQRSESVKQMLLLECRIDVEDSSLSAGHAGRPCGSMTYSNYCHSPVLVWTSGNEEMTFPPDIGLPIGTNFGGTDHYMLQVLYFSLSDSSSEGADSSGLQVLLTSRKPKHEAALMEVGLRTQASMILPPRQPSVAIRGWCLDSCLDQVISSKGITIVSVLMLAQSAARRIILRHLQTFDELPPIAMDLGYQVDQQEIRMLDPRIHIYSGDSLTLECQYNTQDKDRATLGGIGPEDEYCRSYLLYYPRISLASCLTQPSNGIFGLLGFQLPSSQSLNGDVSEVIAFGRKLTLKDAILNLDWGITNISSQLDSIQRELLQMNIQPYCTNAFGELLDSNRDDELIFYQDQLIPLNKVTRCGIWDKALRQERERNCSQKLHYSIIFIVHVTLYIISVFNK